MWSAEKIREWMDKIEWGITQIALEGTDLVPKIKDEGKLRSLADALFDLSEGRNEVRRDKKGRPNIMYNEHISDKANLDYLSGSGTYFTVPSWGTSVPHKNVHPGFIRNNLVTGGWRIGKYKHVRVNGKNYPVSLFGLDPGYGTGGITESYNGIAAACDDANASTDFPEGDDIGNITQAMFYFYSLLSVTEGFHMRGADYYGRAYNASSEYGAPCGYNYQGRYIHVKNGSGPDSWFHDGTRFGIYGLIGCTREIVWGFQLEAGKLLFIPNNNAMIMSASLLADSSSEFKALDLDNNFVARDTTENVCYYDYLEDPGTTNAQKSFQLKASLSFQQSSDSPYGGMSLSSLTASDEFTDVPLYLRLMGCFPLLTSTPRGNIYMRNTSTRKNCGWPGSRWNNGSGGGFGSLNAADYSFGTSGYSGSGRVASELEAV